jgi:CHAD domain-containing protein
MPDAIWSQSRKRIVRARRTLRAGEPEGVHDLRVALRRLLTLAAAARRRKLAADARRVLRRLSPLRQIEVERTLLRSLVEGGILSPSAATSIDERLRLDWARRRKRAESTLAGKRLRRLLRRLGRKRIRMSSVRLRRRLQRQSDSAPVRAVDPRRFDDDALHRTRLEIKQARYALEARRSLGEPGLDPRIEELRLSQDRLGDFNDLRLFARDLVRMRRVASREGAVTQAGNVDAALEVLLPRVDAARKTAQESLARAPRTAAG